MEDRVVGESIQDPWRFIATTLIQRSRYIDRLYFEEEIQSSAHNLQSCSRHYRI
ncbi:hypothetical protein HanPSC8_Chr17g0792451 [Helianthus annuus]|nr:hypothetical protein HanPSC8_Chr17g0792451 [Helianthus annuus]